MIPMFTYAGKWCNIAMHILNFEYPTSISRDAGYDCGVPHPALHLHNASKSISFIALSVRSEVFRHNQDSVGTRGLYRHIKVAEDDIAFKLAI